MVRAIVACVACVACIACQGQGTSGAGPAGGGSATREDASAAVASGSLDAATAEPDAPARPDEPDGTGGPRDVADPGRAIAELGAIPVWQAVVDRAQLLGRRGQHGVVFGRVGPALLIPGPPPAPAVDGGVAAAAGGVAAAARPAVDGGVAAAAKPAVDGGVATARSAVDGGVAAAAGGASAAATPAALIDAGLVKSPYVWLVDDTEGNGSLGIRIALGDKAKEGDRIAAGGAWQLDADRRWFWKPDAVQPLPAAPASDLKEAQPPAPSHAVASGELPGGARTIGVARDGDAVYFQIVGPAPGSDGDGWQIADQLGSPAVAVMNLPGERPSYGGQDMRASDERWQLRRGQTYWVRIGKLRKRGLDKPAQVNARTAPIRVL